MSLRAVCALDHLDEVLERMFIVTNETRRMEMEIDKLRQQLPSGSPFGCIHFLLKDINCGSYCAREVNGKRCTFLDQARESVGALLQSGSLLGKYPYYPLVFLHADWRTSDMRALEAVIDGRVRCFWLQIRFDENTIPPSLYDVERTLTGWRRLHPNGDIRVPGKGHGYGYHLMCRFYSGIIFHAPILRRFDYYLRIDGDSRLRRVDYDL